MNATDLDLLLTLAKIDRQLLNFKKIRDALPVDQARQQLRVEAAQTNFAEIENSRRDAALTAEKLRKEILEHESEIQSLAGKLDMIKNQKEYAIITERQQDLRRQIKTAEDRSLANFEESENLQRAFQEKQDDLAAETAALKKCEQDAAAKIDEIKIEQKKLIEIRKAQLAKILTVSPELADLYQRCSQRGKGVAVAKLSAGVCSECHRRAPANLVALVTARQNIEKNLCNSCGRLLYADISADPPEN